MFQSLLKGLFRDASAGRNDAADALAVGELRLHIGGEVFHPGWKILNVRPGATVDFVGHCSDLRQFDDASVADIYASHVIEHLGFKHELPAAVNEFSRILVPGGMLRIGVPDLAVLCSLYVDPQSNAEDRYQIMRMIYGGQLNAADFHHAGFDEESLTARLQKAGFVDVVRVATFGLFDDSSNYSFRGRPISLNLCARKAVRANVAA